MPNEACSFQSDLLRKVKEAAEETPGQLEIGLDKQPAARAREVNPKRTGQRVRALDIVDIEEAVFFLEFGNAAEGMCCFFLSPPSSST